MNRQTCWGEILLSSRKTPWIKILSMPSKYNELPDQAFFCITPKRKIQFAPSLPEIISRGAVTTQESRDLHKAIRAARANGLFQTRGHINYAEVLIVCCFTDSFLFKKKIRVKKLFHQFWSMFIRKLHQEPWLPSCRAAAPPPAPLTYGASPRQVQGSAFVSFPSPLCNDQWSSTHPYFLPEKNNFLKNIADFALFSPDSCWSRRMSSPTEC